MIQVKNLSVKMGGKYILKDISFSVKKSQSIAIIGPSGSGKSTILRCINNLQGYNKGSILVEGPVGLESKRNYESWSIFRKFLHKYISMNANKISQKVGMVFQGFNLFPHMNVLENLIYAPMKVGNLDYAKAILLAKENLKLVGLSSKIYEMPSRLSGGQKQRVAIARCLMTGPEVILFDEPTSALDPEVIKEVVDVITSLKEKGVTMIIVTHHIHFAKKIADRILFIDHGILLENSEVQDFFEKPKSHRARLFLDNLELI